MSLQSDALPTREAAVVVSALKEVRRVLFLPPFLCGIQFIAICYYGATSSNNNRPGQRVLLALWMYMTASLPTQLDHNHFVCSSILQTQEPQFHIRFVDVQRQSGWSDCGLFAIANSTTLCGGLDPHLQNFEQSKMREHLKKCLFINRLECFPESRRRRRLGQHRFVATKTVDVFCNCRLTWS